MNQKILIPCSENKVVKGIMTFVIGSGFMAIDVKNLISSGFKVSLYDYDFLHIGFVISLLGILFLFTKKYCRINPESDEKVIEVGFIFFGFIPLFRKVSFTELECCFKEAKTRSPYFNTWSVKLAPEKKTMFSWNYPTIGEFEYENNAIDLANKIEQTYKNANKVVVATRYTRATR